MVVEKVIDRELPNNDVQFPWPLNLQLPPTRMIRNTHSPSLNVFSLHPRSPPSKFLWLNSSAEQSPAVITNFRVVIRCPFTPGLKIAAGLAFVILARFAALAKRLTATTQASQGLQLQKTSTPLEQIPKLFRHQISPISVLRSPQMPQC